MTIVSGRGKEPQQGAEDVVRRGSPGQCRCEVGQRLGHVPERSQTARRQKVITAAHRHHDVVVEAGTATPSMLTLKPPRRSTATRTAGYYCRSESVANGSSGWFGVPPPHLV